MALRITGNLVSDTNICKTDLSTLLELHDVRMIVSAVNQANCCKDVFSAYMLRRTSIFIVYQPLHATLENYWFTAEDTPEQTYGSQFTFICFRPLPEQASKGAIAPH